MNKIDNLFETKKKQGKTVFILYVTAGFPDMKTTEEIIPELEKSGADLIELGVPFSDPIADGPTIQKASAVALESGATLHKILQLVRRLRKKTEIPIVLFSAYNPFIAFNQENLLREASSAGVDGILVPDLPPEEADELISLCDKKNLSHIFLVAPTTTPERTKTIVDKSSGFIYYISTRGVTGARKDLDKGILSHIRDLKKMTEKPVAVGFGISSPEHVRKLKKHTDGIIVGSALIRQIEKGKNRKERIQNACKFTRSLAAEM